jgi:phosphate transport system substrate-binding protein
VTVYPSSRGARARSTFSVAIALMSVLGCSKSEQAAPKEESKEQAAAEPAAAPEKSAHPIAIDGSSTVFPISEAMAEEFKKKSGAEVTVATSGTGGGFKKFCAKEIAISGASRPIKQSEVDACKATGVEFVELPIAFDGIAVMVNTKNTWVDKLTVEELKKLWAPAPKDKPHPVTTWADVRKGFPKEKISLFGPGTDSGTFDYFTKAIVGEEKASRGDFGANEDDNILVKGIAGDKNALGYFGLSYYEENKDSLKLVPIDDGVKENGDGAILPSKDTIVAATYQPLSRPIFIYVNKAEADRKEVQDFVKYYVGDGVKLIEEVGYVALPAKTYELVRDRFEKRVTGSVFAGAGSKVGVSVHDLLAGK